MTFLLSVYLDYVVTLSVAFKRFSKQFMCLAGFKSSLSDVYCKKAALRNFAVLRNPIERLILKDISGLLPRV